MARELMYPPMLILVLATTWVCVVPPCSADATAPVTTTAAGSQDIPPVKPTPSPAPLGSAAAAPASTAASPATSTASKKLTLPIPADFGFGGGYGGQSVPGGGLGGFNGFEGGFGGCCRGGFNGFGGNGGLGYDNGPLYFGSAPATRLRVRSMFAGNGIALLLMASVAAMFYM